jgi:hypothetical protein
MQISVNSNQITAPAAPANIAGGVGVVAVDEAENADSVAFAPIDAVSISEAGRRASEQPIQSVQVVEKKADDADSDRRDGENGGEVQAIDPGDEERSGTQRDVSAERKEAQDKAEQRQQQADLAVIRELKARDAEVKAHEAAHAAVGGELAGSPSYTYEKGPDGVRYAVGGEVSIDASKVAGDPQATLEKMQRVQRAALAPAEPSTQDRQVAALAAQQAAEARSEILSERRNVAETESDKGAQSLSAEDRAAEEKEKKEKAEAAEKRKDSQTAADVFSEQNQRLRRINEFLLEISTPPAANAGDLIDDVV